MSKSADASRRAGDLLTDLDLWDIVLAQLHEEGFSQVESIKATVERLGLPLADAKRIVHLSAAWEDRRSANDGFHQLLDESARSGA